MKKRSVYRDEKIKKIRIVQDFLPPPDQLAFREDKVTPAPSKRSMARRRKGNESRGAGEKSRS